MAVFVTGGGVKPSLYDEHTLLLLHGDEFKDSSIYGNTVSNEGVTVSKNQSKFGTGSYYFNGQSRLYIPGDFFNPGSEDFTIDFWAYQVSGSGAFFASTSGISGKIMFGYPANENTLGIGREQVAWDIKFAAGAGTTKNVWQHIAIVRSNGVVTLYVNGSAYGSGNSTQDYNTTGTTFDIGIQSKNLYGTQYAYTGYIEEYRVSDIARWTQNFAPPTEPNRG